MKAIFSLLLMSLSIGMYAQQNEDLVKWSFDINQVGEKDYELVFRADLEPGWVLYSKDTDEGGPIPTHLTFTSNNFDLLGEPTEMGDRKEGVDELFEMKVIKYSSKAPYIMKQKIRLNDMSKPIYGYVTYMLCSNNMCLPPADAEFSFTINVVHSTIEMGSDGQSPKSLKKGQ